MVLNAEKLRPCCHVHPNLASGQIQCEQCGLTLSTRVPETWTGCTVTQGYNSRTIPVKEGRIIYEALPGAVEIVISPK